MGISPDMIIGDMDTVKEIPENLPQLRVPAEKDITDTQLCIDVLYEKGYRHITLLCALGGRCDHMFANLMLLGYASGKGIELVIKNDSETVFLCENSCVLNISDGKTFSVFPVGGNCHGVYEKGSKYPLTDAVLPVFGTLGISNEIVEDIAEIGVKSGKLMVIQTKTPID